MGGYVPLGNFSCNLCRNKTAHQVARIIAKCNRGLNLHKTITYSNIFIINIFSEYVRDFKDNV